MMNVNTHIIYMPWYNKMYPLAVNLHQLFILSNLKKNTNPKVKHFPPLFSNKTDQPNKPTLVGGFNPIEIISQIGSFPQGSGWK